MRVKAVVIAALMGIVVAGQSRAQDAPPLKFETFVLDNGMTFIVHEDHSTPIAAVNVWFDVGSANEEPGRSGFAHLFEHMLFEETEQLSPGDFKRYILGAGGTYNGTTNQDRTAYYETLPSNRLNLAFWLESERMANLRVTQDNFDRERQVVKEERRMRVDNQPYQNGVLTLDTLINDWGPYDHSVIGSMADLESATVGDVTRFYARYYVPNNATVVVAGDVTVDQVRKMADEYFGGIPRGDDPEPLPPIAEVPRSDGERRTTVEDKFANLPAYLAGFNIPPHSADDTYALELLSSMFSEGESSRLFQRLVKEEAAALFTFAFLDSRVGPGGLWVAAIPNQGVDVEQIEALINEEIEKLQTEGVGERELQKAKNQMRAGLIDNRETVFAKTQEIQHYRLYHGDVAQINSDMERYMRITTEDISRVANKYLVPLNRSVVIVVPASSEEKPKAATS